MRAEFGASCFSSCVQPLRFVFQGARTVARFGIQRQREQLVDGGDQAVVVARIDIEQIARCR